MLTGLVMLKDACRVVTIGTYSHLACGREPGIFQLSSITADNWALTQTAECLSTGCCSDSRTLALTSSAVASSSAVSMLPPCADM